MPSEPNSSVVEVLFEKVRSILRRDVEQGVASEATAAFVNENGFFALPGHMRFYGVAAEVFEAMHTKPSDEEIERSREVYSQIAHYAKSYAPAMKARSEPTVDYQSISGFARRISIFHNDGGEPRSESFPADPVIVDRIAKEALRRGIPVEEALVSAFAQVFGVSTGTSILFAVLSFMIFGNPADANDRVPPDLFSLLQLSIVKLLSPCPAFEHVLADFEARYPGYRYVPNALTFEFPAHKTA